MKTLNTVQEATDWLFNEEMVDEDCVDNFRFAFKDDTTAMKKYREDQESGCCGWPCCPFPRSWPNRSIASASRPFATNRSP